MARLKGPDAARTQPVAAWMQPVTAQTQPVAACIHLDALKANIAYIQTLAGTRQILAPVKADAYGHGAVEIARAALAAGVTHLGVARVSEAAELREQGVTAPILLFSRCPPYQYDDAIALDVSFFIGDAEWLTETGTAAAAGAAAGKGRPPVTIYIKVDTGMGRLGCPPETAIELVRLVQQFPAPRLGGICTHLAVSDSDDSADIAYTKQQIKRFTQAVDGIRAAGLSSGILSAAASGGLLYHPESHFDLVRPGILLYGYSPSGVSPSSVASSAASPVKPVMELTAQVSFIKRVHRGESVSYGRTWTAPRDTVIATLPIGYGDGLPRLSSGSVGAFIRGKRYPQVGRICMDQCMVDLGSDPDVRLWDEAVIFGGPSPDTAATIARAAQTIPYEVLTGITKRVPRLYLGG